MATPPKFAAGDKLRAGWRELVGALGRVRRGPSASRRGPAPAYPVRQPSRWLRNLVLVGLVVGGSVLAWQWSSLRERTLIGSAYAARIGCVCHFVSQRDLKSCEGDLAIAPLSGVAGMVWLDADDAERSVSAGLPLLGSQTAHYDRDYGCRLEPWKD
ncbi:hypothetical protein [Novosphingobium profundi]|uniref:hypothetical protein n=1 Tax=Novosphingobium profundi TaxID=1774954 RepID=UPI001FE4A8AB|nr:hypothetical protein [Novosphingobium profundi]